ncbi:hypothetical protein TNCV_4680341 [Trichonephila clavipes]|nr:hypothetical protein TNCV_4680341 [Trichonephila clavipes]
MRPDWNNAKRLGAFGAKVFEKGSKQYRISMTMFAHTFPVNLRPLQTVLRLYLDDEVKEAGQDFFKNQPRAFYSENIDQLPK